MKSRTKPELKSLLFMTLEEEVGIIVREPAGAVKTLRRKLEALRAADPIFQGISIALSPTDPEHELWLIHNRKPISHGEEG